MELADGMDMAETQEGEKMNCPVCDEKLREVEKHGVQIDLCPACKGVWLDRGELEKMLEIVQADPVAGAAPQAPIRGGEHGHREERHGEHGRHGDDDHDHDRRGDDGYARGGHGAQPQRRKSLLGEILGSLGGD